MKQVWIYVTVLIVGGAIYMLVAPKASKDDGGVEGFEDLIPCTFLTSMDSQRSLYLSSNHQARWSDKSGAETRWDIGTWELLDDDNHIYRITVDGSTIDYTLVSAPEGEGCMLVAGKVDAADLTKSWFSDLTDPK